MPKNNINLKEIGWLYYPFRRDIHNDDKIKSIIKKYNAEGLGIVTVLLSIFWEHENRVTSLQINRRIKALNFNSEIVIDILHNFGMFKINDGLYYNEKIERLCLERTEMPVIEFSAQRCINLWNDLKKRNRDDLRRSKCSKRTIDVMEKRIISESQLKCLLWMQFYLNADVNIDRVVTIANCNNYLKLVNEFKVKMYAGYQMKKYKEQRVIDRIINKLNDETVYELLDIRSLK